MSSTTVYFEQKKKIKSSLTLPTWLYNLLFVVMGGDEKETRKVIKRLALQGTALHVENVSQFVQQELIMALLGIAEQIVSGEMEADAHTTSLLLEFASAILPAKAVA